MKLAATPINITRQRGSILVICMVLAGIGTIGAAAFFSLIQAKSVETLERETAMNRRVTLANSRAVAREILMRDHLGAPTVPPGGTQVFTITTNGGWGEAEIQPHLAAPLVASSATRMNKTGFVSPVAFTEDISVVLGDGNSTIPYLAHAKSYHPALAGDLLVGQTRLSNSGTPTQFTGNLLVKGRAVFFPSVYSGTASPIRTDRILKVNPIEPLTSMLDTSGKSILPENSALPPVTSGVIGSGASYDGRLLVNANPDATVNDYADYVAANGGITLGGFSPYAMAGNTPYVTTESVSTVPPNANDGGAMDLINAANSPFNNGLPTALRAMRPLSSAVMSALLAKATIVDTTHVKTVLMDNSPLPQDVLTAMMSSTALTSADKWSIVRANPVGVAYDGAGTLYVDIDSTAATHLSIAGDFVQVTLHGQVDSTTYTNAAALPALVIALQCGSSAGQISIEGQNNRPFIFAVGATGSPLSTTATFAGTAFPNWRSLLEFEEVELNIITSSAVGAATLTGGIRTSRSINVTGTLTLVREADPTALQTAACRTAWLEIYNVP